MVVKLLAWHSEGHGFILDVQLTSTFLYRAWVITSVAAVFSLCNAFGR